MNYLDVYWSRLNHNGETTGERIRNSNIRSFEKWLDESPFTVRDLSVERGLYFDGIIQENKDKEHKKIMFLHVANDIPLIIGDIMNWKLDSGELEKWLIYKEEKKTNPAYRTFEMIRCNYLLKWVNQEGHIQQSWSYCTSSLDSMIKANFRTWHNLKIRVLGPRGSMFKPLNCWEADLYFALQRKTLNGLSVNAAKAEKSKMQKLWSNPTTLY